MDLEDLKELVSSAGYEPHPYSARWMNTRECFSFTSTDTQLETIAALADSWEGDTSDFGCFLRDVEVDLSGVGVIYYFPDVEWCD